MTASPLDGIDITWLSDRLRERGQAVASVASVTVETLPFTGATTDIARLQLSYEPDAAPGPSSMIAKVRGMDALRRQVDAGLGLFARELRFYEELAGRVPVRVPRTFALGDGDANPILLEDLGALRLGDQAAGLSVTDGEQVLDALADLHAAFWEAAELDASWLCRPNERVYSGMATQLIQSGIPAFRERYAHRLPRAFVASTCDAAERWPEITDVFVRGPHTLAHNDCRLDNIFFARDGAPIFLDWQTVAATRGSQDVGNLLAGSMSAEDLSAQWERLLRRYHGRLVAAGVQSYDFDECVLHYRQNVVYALGQGLVLLGAFDSGDGRGLGDRILARVIPHAIELDSFAALELDS